LTLTLITESVEVRK